MNSEDAAMRAELRDHWWWRPGWSVGRSFYTWHVTFADQPAMHELANHYAPMLTELPMFDPVPLQWLHLTMQGVGFTDEVEGADVDKIVRGARSRLADRRPFRVAVGPLRLDPEGLQLPVRPVEPLRELRARVRKAIAQVWGVANVPEAAEGWRPHVSLAYANAAGPIQPVAEALAIQPARTADVEISTVSLIQLNRDNKMYVWAEMGRVGLGDSGS